MRTDTQTFTDHAFKAIRALGVGCATSRQLARQISTVLKHGGYSASGEHTPAQREIPDFAVELNMGIWGRQSLSVIVGETVIFSVTTREGVIVSTEATAAQRDLAIRMEAAQIEIREGLAATTATYDTLRDESLAINPFAPAHIVDQRLYSEFSDWYKAENGSRPGPNWSVAEIRRWMERETADMEMTAAA